VFSLFRVLGNGLRRRDNVDRIKRRIRAVRTRS
jgi:hypothetical protein